MLIATVLTAAVLSASTEPATDVTTTTATLHGTVSAADGYYFDYGTTNAYGLSTERHAVAGGGDVAATAALTNLTANTTYHYRVIAHNAFGTVEGPDRQFTTQGTAPFLLLDDRVEDDRRGAAENAAAGFLARHAVGERVRRVVRANLRQEAIPQIVQRFRCYEQITNGSGTSGRRQMLDGGRGRRP